MQIVVIRCSQGWVLLEFSGEEILGAHIVEPFGGIGAGCVGVDIELVGQKPHHVVEAEFTSLQFVPQIVGCLVEPNDGGIDVAGFEYDVFALYVAHFVAVVQSE